MQLQVSSKYLLIFSVSQSYNCRILWLIPPVQDTLRPVAAVITVLIFCELMDFLSRAAEQSPSQSPPESIQAVPELVSAFGYRIMCHGLYGSFLGMCYFSQIIFIMSEDDNEFMGVAEKQRKLSAKNTQVTTIRVVVKMRPLLSSESGQKECVVVKEDGKTVQINDPPNTTRETIDKAFSKQSTQKQLYEYVSSTIDKIAEGFNVTVLSYGQTGSGKTYTMFGSDWDSLIQQAPQDGKRQTTFFGNISADENFAGLIPRCMHHLFSKLYFGKKNVSIFCSFLQLYNEKLIDLLQNADKQLIIHESKADGIYVEGLSETKVSSFEECVNLMKKGERNRTVRQTHMNTKSSRSHSIFQFLIEEVFPDRSYRRTKLNLCDLAGSEKINKAEEMQIVHFKQLKNINLSLTTLGKVIWSLSSKDSSIPCYRDSKLTRLLQDSLGGNTFTTIIGNITSKASSLQQTVNTLKFVQRARQVRTEVFVKSYKDQPELQQMQKEISYLRSILKMKKLPSEHKELAEKIKDLQMENRRLRKIADEESHSKLKDENTQMKIQLERLQIDRLFLNSPNALGTRATLELKSEQPEARKLMTSQTIDKHSTNSSHLPQLRSRYSNHSSHRPQEKHINMNVNQNIILRRLDLIERMKVENKDRLDKKLRDLEKNNRTLDKNEPGYRPHELQLSRNQRRVQYPTK